MKPWLPVIITTLIAFLINAYPIFMAFVVGDRAWAQAGWALYFFTIPAAVVLLVAGAVLTAVLLNRQQKLKANGQ